MPCCHIPTLINPDFPQCLIPDTQRFAQYVGGVPLCAIDALQPAGILTSALHLEMKLWEPTPFTYLPNDAQGNSWQVMLVVMGGIIGSMVVAMFLPILSLSTGG